MEPTLFLAWLSHPTAGGYWTAEQREELNPRDWHPTGPLHLSLHTSREGADAALLAAARQEYDASELAYAHGPMEQHSDLLSYLTRHVGYAAHVTEQPVELDTEAAEPSPEEGEEEEHRYPCPSCGGTGCPSCSGSGERIDPPRLSRPLGGDLLTPEWTI